MAESPENAAAAPAPAPPAAPSPAPAPAMKSSPPTRFGIPLRYDLDAKWDACLDLSIRRVAYSSLGGAFGGLILFRCSMWSPKSVSFTNFRGLSIETAKKKHTTGSITRIDDLAASEMHIPPTQDQRSPTTRWASVALGAGVGIGAAFTECSYIFNGSPPNWSAPECSYIFNGSPPKWGKYKQVQVILRICFPLVMPKISQSFCI
ncbi:hypothetical protein VPH35_134602 [Triticum aestivum]|uniref:Uncharacterized protein n=1 Tax=Aegilops tauschii TaxID=37682 RepID=M8AYE5_AEGTA